MQHENITKQSENASIETRLARLEVRLSRIESKAKPIDYQGWSSYDTWVVSLWMDHDVQQYAKTTGRALHHLRRNGSDKQAASITFAEELKEEIEKGVPSYIKGVYADLLAGALSQVNFYEIASHHLEGVQLPESKEEKAVESAMPSKARMKAVDSRTKNTLTATPEVLDFLSRSTIDDEGLTLPDEQLLRDQYEAVNKFLDLAGAKWNKSKQRHIFKAGAKAKIDALLASGEIVDEQKLFQAFYTPAAIAAELVELAGVETGMSCLEPSAGAGAIAEAIRAKGASFHCIEMNPEAAAELKAKGFEVEVSDFLSVPADPSFDRVILNPPFTNDQDIKHVRHAFEFLKSGGKLLAIMSPGFTFGSSKTRSAFRDFVADHDRVVKELEGGSFAESGTGVRTVIVELTKPAESFLEQSSLFTAA